MAKRESESEKVDNQRGKTARAKGDQSSADDTDGSSSAPSRVHIFKGKGESSSTSPSKSGHGDEPLRCSSFGTNRLAGFTSASVAGNSAISPEGIQRRIVDFSEQMRWIKCQIQIHKKAMYDVAMKAEDLEGMLQGLRRTRDRIFRSRR